MKLFVWNNPLPTHYSGNIIHAVAENEEAARRVAGHPTRWANGEFLDPLPDSWPPIALGPPTRVIDLAEHGGAYAELYEWEE